MHDPNDENESTEIPDSLTAYEGMLDDALEGTIREQEESE